jgi:hypothetical protein
MKHPAKLVLTLAAAAVIVYTAPSRGLEASDADLLPPQLAKEQRENLQRFLQQHEKPDRYIPRDAKLVDSEAAELGTNVESTPAKPIKQYTVQIISHRPVPGEQDVKRVDVYYYRPNPEKGKPGITVRHTVDVTTGKQVGPTEVLVKHHAPVSREELAEAVELAREKSGAVKELYGERDPKAVRWEYLQLMISRTNAPHEPGDRVVRFVFTASPVRDEAPPAPVRVIVNLTKGVVLPDAR